MDAARAAGASEHRCLFKGAPRDVDPHPRRLMRARFHGSPPSGVDIVKASYGRDPLVVAVVDLGEGAVTEIRTPPSHVKWGAISTPMF
jgi:hypothetical protein